VKPIARYEFGSFTLDLTSRVLLRSGEAIEIAPKALELLLALLEKPGRVVSKREILTRVWPDTFVEESNIAQNVSLVRKALGEGMIITVPRLGYQFAGAMRAIPQAEEPRESIQSIAVFPFTAVAGEAGQVGTLLADAVAGGLRQLQSIFVQTPPAAQATRLDDARALGVDAFLDGYFQRSGTWWHVAVHLVRVHDGTMVWSTSVRGDFGTVTDARDGVSNEVVSALRSLLHDGSHPMIDAVNREAFHHYLRGRHFWNKRTDAALKEAFHCATKAVEVDPTYVRGHLGIADTYNLLGGQHAVLAPAQAFPRARAAAFRALEIDESCGEAYASLAFVNCWYDWDDESAERNFRRAMEIKPMYATAYHWWAEWLACASRFDESFAQFEIAIALDPLSSAIQTDFAVALSLAGEYARCEAMLADVLQFDAGFTRALGVWAMNRERMRDYAIAGEYATRALEHEPHSPSLLALLARVQVGAGRDARETLRQLELLENAPRTELASVYAALRDYPRAEERIADAFARREAHLVWTIFDSRFDALRAETDLMRRWTETRNACT
jgi:DNA-binding winged helix-turn-helix (wHTH) protein/Tfp pilus assembly protein PilF